MQVDSPDKIRNVAVAGHNDTGKTTLVSALLYAGGVTTRLQPGRGRQHPHRLRPRGGRARDLDRPRSLLRPLAQHKVNLIDCPGYGIFFTEAGRACAPPTRSCSASTAVAGVEVNTEKVWSFAEEIGLPVMLHLTKMDRERADFEPRPRGPAARASAARCCRSRSRSAPSRASPAWSTWSQQKAYRYTRDGNGKAEPAEIPAEMADEVEAAASAAVEAVAETDDQLMEGFFESGTLSQEDLEAGLRRRCARRQIFPLTLAPAATASAPRRCSTPASPSLPSPADRAAFPAASLGGDAGRAHRRSPAPAAALVFKTLSDPFTGKISILRVVSGTLRLGLRRLQQPRRGDGAARPPDGPPGQAGRRTCQQLIAGDIGGVAKLKLTATGDTLCAKDRPLRVALDRGARAGHGLRGRAQVQGRRGEDRRGARPADGRGPDAARPAATRRPTSTCSPAPASSTSRSRSPSCKQPLPRGGRSSTRRRCPTARPSCKPADGHGRHKKQTGGRGQFADCKIKIEPLPRGEDFYFVDEIFGGAIPHNFRPAVEKGIQEARRRGFLAGYPVVDFKVRLLDGQYHDVDSSELAFKIAGSLAFKDAMAKARPTLLEPIMKVEITTTEEFMGDIMGDLSQRRGRPQGMDSRNGNQVIKATVPMSEMLNYAPALRSMTQGRSSFHMEFSHYEEVPRPVQEKIIAEASEAPAGGARIAGARPQIERTEVMNLIQATQLRAGMCILFERDVCRVMNVAARHAGQLRGFVQARMRSLRNGNSFEHRFGSTEKVERAILDTSRWSTSTPIRRATTS